MGPDEIRAWVDAVGPAALIGGVLVFLLIPMIRRDRTEGHNSDDLATIRVRVEILWAKHMKGE